MKLIKKDGMKNLNDAFSYNKMPFLFMKYKKSFMAIAECLVIVIKMIYIP